MAKTFTSENSTSPQVTKKQRKKQAKREAKLMLKIERAQKDVQRAEQKVARAQDNLEKSRTFLSELQAKHASMSSPQELYPISTMETTDQTQPETGETASTSSQSEDSQAEEQDTTPPPVEGRSDIFPEDDTSSAQSSTTSRRSSRHKGVQIESGGGSMPLETDNELAWPPPKIREEVAEAIEEEMDSTPITERNTTSLDNNN